MNEESRLRRAGVDNVVFNAPLGAERAARLADGLDEGGVSSVVDLGCGRGEMARLIAQRTGSTTVVGVDDDPHWVGLARALTVQSGLADRVVFELGDAAAWSGEVDGAVCVGVSHAFGGFDPMVARLDVLLGDGLAVVGEGVWDDEPDDWCRATFGDLPRGLDGITRMAETAGWTVEDADSSTLDEWDEFEHGWIAGVRNLATPEAEAFAAEREAGYGRYRGVLGFAWLRLRSSACAEAVPGGTSLEP